MHIVTSLYRKIGILSPELPTGITVTGITNGCLVAYDLFMRTQRMKKKIELRQGNKSHRESVNPEGQGEPPFSP